MTDMITINNLTKSFGDILAVDNLSLNIKSGEVFGILGPNGAGKTTTIRMLSSLIGPTSGSATVAGLEVGKDNQEIRRNVGILTESPGLYDRLTAERNLLFFARLHEVEDPEGQVEKYLKMLELWGRRRDVVGGFSKGMRQKMAIARALLHEPKVLFLDEPTSGLDPEMSKLVREFIGELRQDGRVIVICTHNLDEADRLCDRVAIFKTKLIALDTPANMRKQLDGRRVVFHLSKAEEKFAQAMAKKKFVTEAQVIDNKVLVTLDDPETHNPEMVRDLVGAGAEIQFVGEIRQSLEDAYLSLIQDGEENEDE